MRLSDLTFREHCQQGICADFFNINSRFHGYTYDRQMFHVTDDNDSTRPQSYTAAQLDSALQSGFFTGTGTITNTETYGPPDNTQSYFEPNTPGWGAKEYFFVGLGALALVYFAWEGTR